MGGGGGGTFSSRTPADLAKQVRKQEEAAANASFKGELSTMFANLLGQYNGRDASLVQERLDETKSALEGTLEGSFDQLYGGSVAKHTYVDGLSDIDCLLVINETELDGQSPRRALDRITRILRRKLESDVEISHSRMAVTIDYSDGMKIQLLPVLQTADVGLRIPSSRTNEWSEINPEGFRDALSRRNEECAGKLIPTIKLAKAIIGTLPESQRLSGYHVESLAIAAFKNYHGTKTTVDMLPTLFEKAKSLVLAPIRDSTGQSVHVDGYLGPANSDLRVAASHILNRLEKRMRNATLAESKNQWEALFGLHE